MVNIFFLKFQIPVTLCSGEFGSFLVVRPAQSTDLRSRFEGILPFASKREIKKQMGKQRTRKR